MITAAHTPVMLSEVIAALLRGRDIRRWRLFARYPHRRRLCRLGF